MVRKSRLLAAVAAVAVLASVVVSPAAADMRRTDRVQAEDMDVWQYVANVPAEVRVDLRGDGDTDLDLLVLDGQDRVVALDVGPSDRATVRFSAKRGQTYRIVVVNHGGVYNNYTLHVQD